MKLEEYRERLAELDKLPWNECRQKAAELQVEYLSRQTVPDAETAVKCISEAQLPELGGLQISADDCELLDLLDEESPDERWWRCGVGEAIVDVSAQSGEVCLMSA